MRFERKASFRSTGRSADADMEGIWTYLKNAMDVLIPGNGNAGSANTGMNFILNREERRGATTKDRVALRNKALNLTARTPQVNAALCRLIAKGDDMTEKIIDKNYGSIAHNNEL